jgi:hypothetical protein
VEIVSPFTTMLSKLIPERAAANTETAGETQAVAEAESLPELETPSEAETFAGEPDGIIESRDGVDYINKEILEGEAENVPDTEFKDLIDSISHNND